MERGEIEKSFLVEDILPAGVDEVGRGCIAGPVFAATVVLDYDRLFALDESTLAMIRDSKKLSSRQRANILPTLDAICIQSAIASATVEEIDQLGISQATFLAMSRALHTLDTTVFQVILVDGNQLIPEELLPKNRIMTQRSIVKGDHWCYAIAASSIYAKQARDSFMQSVSNDFPEYGFERHVGYGTADHISQIHKHGPSVWHRASFEPIRSLVAQK